jgi:hypothetical protein
MFAPVAWALLLSPVDLVELSIERTVFPKCADQWDRIGLFKLKDGGRERLLLLYQDDSDLWAWKMMRKHGMGVMPYPNSFSLHAVYQDDRGKWAHKELYAVARVGFVGVKKTGPGSLVLEFKPKFILRVEPKPGEDLADAIKRAQQINKPFTKTLALVEGVPTVSADPPVPSGFPPALDWGLGLPPRRAMPAPAPRLKFPNRDLLPERLKPPREEDEPGAESPCLEKGPGVESGYIKCGFDSRPLSRLCPGYRASTTGTSTSTW